MPSSKQHPTGKILSVCQNAYNFTLVFHFLALALEASPCMFFLKLELMVLSKSPYEVYVPQFHREMTSYVLLPSHKYITNGEMQLMLSGNTAGSIVRELLLNSIISMSSVSQNRKLLQSGISISARQTSTVTLNGLNILAAHSSLCYYELKGPLIGYWSYLQNSASVMKIWRQVLHI